MSSYLPIIILLIVFLFIFRQEKAMNIRRIIRKRKKKGLIYMNDIFNKYIGKDCIVYISNSSSGMIECNVTGISDNWLTVKTRDGEEAINFDYIVRIKEHPVNKNGKKKSVIF